MKILFVFLVMIIISGCDNGATHTRTSSEKDNYVFLVKGKQLECIKFGYAGSCNWEKYNKAVK